MHDTLFYIIIVMGPIVLLTYLEAWRSPNVTALWGGLPQTTWYKNPWVLSMILTVISFLYMSGMWVFVLEDQQQSELVFSYVLFMTGAILWAPLALIAVFRGEKMLTVAIALWLTAAGSIGFLVNVKKDQPLMVLATVICMLHHVGFDALYWWFTWHPRDTKQALFRFTETETNYDTLNFF
jgi:hypothetical protein